MSQYHDTVHGNYKAQFVRTNFIAYAWLFHLLMFSKMHFHNNSQLSDIYFTFIFLTV